MKHSLPTGTSLLALACFLLTASAPALAEQPAPQEKSCSCGEHGSCKKGTSTEAKGENTCSCSKDCGCKGDAKQGSSGKKTCGCMHKDKEAAEGNK